jgi:hypothetical protein
MLPNHKRRCPCPRFGGILRMITSVAGRKKDCSGKVLLLHPTTEGRSSNEKPEQGREAKNLLFCATAALVAHRARVAGHDDRLVADRTGSVVMHVRHQKRYLSLQGRTRRRRRSPDPQRPVGTWTRTTTRRKATKPSFRRASIAGEAAPAGARARMSRASRSCQGQFADRVDAPTY